MDDEENEEDHRQHALEHIRRTVAHVPGSKVARLVDDLEGDLVGREGVARKLVEHHL